MIKNKVTCVIPAYNEESKISLVLRVVTNHQLIDEIIVVDDHSKDNTYKIAKKFKKVKVIRNRENRGKTFSVVEGIKKAKNQIVLTLDADLVDLTKENISNLILPVITRKASVTIARFATPFLFRWIGADSGSGQRVFKKSLFPLEKLEKIKGYGLESFMNGEIIKDKMKVGIVYWDNVIPLEKSNKSNHSFLVKKYLFVKGFLHMWGEMIKPVGFFNFLAQPFQLASLDVMS